MESYIDTTDKNMTTRKIKERDTRNDSNNLERGARKNQKVKDSHGKGYRETS